MSQDLPSPSLRQTIGAAAREARLRLALTQEDVADRLGIVTEVYGRLERGNVAPSVFTFRKPCLVLNLSADLALDLAGDRTPGGRQHPRRGGSRASTLVGVQAPAAHHPPCPEVDAAFPSPGVSTHRRAPEEVHGGTEAFPRLMVALLSEVLMRHSAPLSLLVLLLTAGCWESRPLAGPPGTEGGGKLSGLVIKGRVAGATVNVHRLTGAERGALVASRTTDGEGAFSVPVGASEGPFLVVATGGSFVDEASGATIRLNTDELTALVPSFPVGTQAEGLLLTPISHLAAGFALRQVRMGTADLGSAHDEAWLLLNAHFLRARSNHPGSGRGR